MRLSMPCRHWALALVLLAGVQAANAEGPKGLARPPADEKRVALVVGNKDYAGQPLQNPLNDARDMKAALEGLGFKVVYRENADLTQMDEAMREFARQLDNDSVGLFYYSGHGMAANDTNYLLPVGVPISSKAELKARGYDARIALDTMEDAGARVSVVILDACRSQPVRGSSGGLGEMGGGAGSIIAFATAPKQTAEDGTGRNGTFTKHLLAHLAEPGLSALQALEQTQTEVAEETRNTQQPWINHGPLRGQFCFAGCAAAESEAERKLREAQERIRQLEAAAQEVPKPVPAVEPPSPPVQPPKPKPAFPFGIEMVEIPGGTFQMGCGPKDGKCFDNEKPRHPVTVSAFALGKTEVTQGQWKAVMGSNPSEFKQCGDDCPVEQVSWNDAQAFIAKLNEKTYNRYGFRLPSEAEWEYACRAGQKTLHCGGDDRDALAWYGNGSDHTHPVGRKRTNAWGLYDMSGNVWEWTCSAYAKNYVSGQETDCPAVAQDRVLRGGSWFNDGVHVRSANRSWGGPDSRYYGTGFRLALGSQAQAGQ
jgi:formylglycine-generating enzyme required for sulfatase activity